MQNILKNIFQKNEQNINKTTIINSNVVQVGGNLVLDSSLVSLLETNQNDKTLLNKLIGGYLQECEKHILHGKQRDALCIIDTIYSAYPKSISNENLERLNYCRAVISVINNDFKGARDKIDYLDPLSISKNKIELVLGLVDNNADVPIISDDVRNDHIYAYMILHGLVHKSMWDYITIHFMPSNQSFHLQDFYCGVAYFNQQNFSDAVKAFDWAISKDALPRYSFMKALGDIILTLDNISDMESDLDILRQQSDNLVKSGNESTELRDSNLYVFNLSRMRALAHLDFSNYINEYYKLEKLYLDDHNFRFLLGSVYQRHGKYDEAIGIYTELFNDKPTQEIPVRIMYSYYLNEEYSKNLDYFEKLQDDYKHSSTSVLYLMSMFKLHPMEFDACFDTEYHRFCNNIEDLSYFLELAHYSSYAKVKIYEKVKLQKEAIVSYGEDTRLFYSFFAAEVPDLNLCLFFLESKNNYTNKDMDMVCSFLNNITSLEIKESIAKWFIDHGFKNYIVLSILAECYMCSERYLSAYPLYKEAFSLNADKRIACILVNLAAVIDTITLKDIYDEMSLLSSYKEPRILLVIAQTYCKLGVVDKAEELSYQAMYLLNNVHDEELYSQYMAIQFMIISHGSSRNRKIDYKRVTVDVVIFLSPTTQTQTEINKDEHSTDIIDTRSSNLIICINQELEFCTDTLSIGALHISKSNILYLKLINKELNELIVYNGKSYVITNIIDKYAYVFRHVESQIDETKNGSIIKKIYLRADENIGDQLSSIISSLGHTPLLLSEYHFENNASGMPIEWINHCDYDEYVHVVQYLLYSKEEALYAGLNEIILDNKTTYVISLSSLVILKLLDNDSILNDHLSNIFIPETLLDFIKCQSEQSSTTLVNSPGRIGLNEDGKLTLIPPDEKMPDFWNSLYEIALKMNVYFVKVIDRAQYYKRYNNFDLESVFSKTKTHVCHLDSFIAADETDSLLLSDDLFFRKLGNFLGIGSVNHTFLYDSLEGDKYYEAIKRLLRTNYSYIPMPNINSSLLTEYCESIVSNDRKKKLYAELLLPLIKD